MNEKEMEDKLKERLKDWIVPVITARDLNILTKDFPLRWRKDLKLLKKNKQINHKSMGAYSIQSYVNPNNLFNHIKNLLLNKEGYISVEDLLKLLNNEYIHNSIVLGHHLTNLYNIKCYIFTLRIKPRC